MAWSRRYDRLCLFTSTALTDWNASFLLLLLGLLLLRIERSTTTAYCLPCRTMMTHAEETTWTWAIQFSLFLWFASVISIVIVYTPANLLVVVRVVITRVSWMRELTRFCLHSIFSKWTTLVVPSMRHLWEIIQAIVNIQYPSVFPLSTSSSFSLSSNLKLSPRKPYI
jgi:hypothetical protein